MGQSFFVKRVAVLGAGVMGAQIAAHCVNAGIETRLYDLSAEGNDKNAMVNKAIQGLVRLTPSPLARPDYAELILARNYDDHLSELTQCDLIIEAIAEKLEWKEGLYQRIIPYLTSKTVLVSNTSGLSVNTLVAVLPASHQKQFCGVHFFNPPRYMHLAELIPTKYTPSSLLDNLETWLTRVLGKGVIRAKDTPNFIANRMGVFSLLATLHHAEQFGLGLDEVDALTGSLLGRPKSATCRTMDVVGLDTMQHVVFTMQTELKDDPWYALFVLPDWINQLILQGHLGQKSGIGCYRKAGKTIEVFDPRLGTYRVADGQVQPQVRELLTMRDPVARMAALFKSSEPQAQFLSACFRDLFHYSAFHLEHIADTPRDVDQGLQWGFGWQEGPFETWQASGMKAILDMLAAAVNEGRSLVKAPLPSWLFELSYFYDDKTAFSPKRQSYVGALALPIYQRQLSLNAFPILYENKGVCLYHAKDDVAVVRFKSKANTIDRFVMDGLQEALIKAEAECQGLVIYQDDATNFSSGADLRMLSDLIDAKKMDELDLVLDGFQQLLLRIKYSAIPVIAGIRGRALGGGCELMMHCDGVVAAFEAYPGLVEVGVGLIPAGGGCKEWAMRAAAEAGELDLMPKIRAYFEQTARAVVASSAPDARSRGFLKADDHWVMHTKDVLYASIQRIKAMQALNYLPPMQQRFKVAGREGHAQLQAILVNGLEGGFISEHDYFLSNQLAYVMCGGDVNAGTRVDEAWMLRLERAAFVRLAETSLTQARIRYLLETGKPLRN